VNAVIVGSGVAAIATVRALRSAGYAGSMTMVSEEAEPPYDRPPLSKQYLAGSLTRSDLRLLRDERADEIGLTTVIGTATRLDTHVNVLTLADGRAIRYDGLVIATGAAARTLPYGEDLAGVHYLRTRRDADSLRKSLLRGGPLVVVGAGFIGLEVAATARVLGLDVTVIEAASAPLTRVLGATGGQVITDIHRSRGVDFRFDARVTGIVGDSRVTAVEIQTLAGTATLAADSVVVGVGAVPRTEWLTGSGVHVEEGVVCDARGRTSAADVYAAGDVSRWLNELTGAHVRMEQWQTAIEQGGIVGDALTADLGTSDVRPRSWASVPYFWSDQYDHKIQFCGAPGAVWESRQTERGWVACCAADETTLSGILAIDGPVALARGRRKVAAKAPWREAVAWLEAL